jgi:hypothetical protein
MSEFSDDAIAERFADACHRSGVSFLWIERRRSWYVRDIDDAGEPVWAPDDLLSVPHLIRIFLRSLTEELPRGKLRMRLGSLATMRAIEELIRADYAGTEADLEPGALAQQEARDREIIEAMRKHAAVPASPVRRELPAVKITLSRRAKAEKRKIEFAREYGGRASAYAEVLPVTAAEDVR